MASPQSESRAQAVGHPHQAPAEEKRSPEPELASRAEIEQQLEGQQRDGHHRQHVASGGTAPADGGYLRVRRQTLDRDVDEQREHEQ